MVDFCFCFYVYELDECVSMLKYFSIMTMHKSTKYKIYMYLIYFYTFVATPTGDMMKRDTTQTPKT